MDSTGSSRLGKLPLEIGHARATMAVPRRQLLSLASSAMVTRRAVIAFGVVVFAAGASAQEPGPFPAPKTEPPIVTAGKSNADAPSDAIVLFNGKDLSRWREIGRASCRERAE